eukprot:Gb_18850 [translate_table: standard]
MHSHPTVQLSIEPVNLQLCNFLHSHIAAKTGKNSCRIGL